MHILINQNPPKKMERKKINYKQFTYQSTNWKLPEPMTRELNNHHEYIGLLKLVLQGKIRKGKFCESVN